MTSSRDAAAADVDAAVGAKVGAETLMFVYQMFENGDC